MKKILIALDYDPTWQKVANTGYALAKEMYAEIILIHVISGPVHYTAIKYPVMGFGGYMNIDPVLLEPAGKKLRQASQKFLDETKSHLSDSSLQTLVEEGDAAAVIIKTAQKLKVSFIVMGSHGRKWLEQIVMGSVTEKVLRQTTIPVLIVPTKKEK
jgi:nucleotide-binding universal stress UspA family protein